MNIGDFHAHVEDFLEIYPRRPIAENSGGMGLNHCFGLFAILRHLRPSVVIESGVWRGQSTWVIEQAVPDARIVCIDPRPDLREYTSRAARYETLDFSGIDWSETDTEDAVCFFDDHQNAYARLMELRWWGFRRAVFEDNFPVGQGDNYSLRHIMSSVGHPRIQMSPAFSPRGRRLREQRREEEVLMRHYWRQQMIRVPNSVDRAALDRNLAVYLETPPILLDDTNSWGGLWEGDYRPSSPALFDRPEDSEALARVISSLPDLGLELQYTYMAYVELRAR